MEQVNVRETREQISQLLERVKTGEEVLIMRWGKPAARLIAPPPSRVTFKSRASLRGELPPMNQSAGEMIRQLRESERF